MGYLQPASRWSIRDQFSCDIYEFRGKVLIFRRDISLRSALKRASTIVTLDIDVVLSGKHYQTPR